MSAFVFCLHRQGKPVSKELFAPMMEAINVYGIDGKKQIIKDNFAIGYQRFWTTPEEVGEKQPLQDKEINTWLMFDGRIDNRQEVYQLLRSKRYSLAAMSDARLFLELYKQTGQKYFKQIIGPFVFVLFNESSNEVFAGRDAMGGRYLVHHITDKWIILATYEIAVSEHKDVGFILDEKRITEYFAFKRPNSNSTCIKNIAQLYPGYELRIAKNNIKFKSAYLLDPERRIRFSKQEEYTEAFKEVFEASVNDRLRGVSSIGSMTSGGMDSLPMSVVAAEILGVSNHKLQTVSWVFDDYVESDEREFIKPIAKKYEFNSIYINCDKEWPLKNGWTINLAIPFSTPYRTFHDLAYKAFQDNKIKTVLSGMGGDTLYIGWEMQIYELINTGRFKEAYNELRRRMVVSDNKVYCLKAHLLWTTSIYKTIRRKIGDKKPDWLVDAVKQYLDNNKHWLYNDAQRALRPHQYLSLLDSVEGEDVACERYYCARYGFEMRYPFRDKRLVEFMLQIPTEYLNFDNITRLLMRQAMKNKLPDIAQGRVGKASFHQVFCQGMIEQNEVMNKYLHKSDNDWLNYVKPSYINCNSNEYNLSLMIRWMCVYLQYWKENR